MSRSEGIDAQFIGSLEFPVVALSGLMHSRYAMVPEGELDEEQREAIPKQGTLIPCFGMASSCTPRRIRAI